METLSVLEKRINQLIETIKNLKEANAQLVKENADLAKKLESLESTVLNENNSIEKLNKEKEMTKTLVDDLIKSIDSFVTCKESQ